VWCPPRGSRRRSGVAVVAHEPANFDRSSPVQFAKPPPAFVGLLRRGWRARRGGCRLVALGPSFMPPFLPFMPPFLPRAPTLVPPLLSDLVPCDTGRRRCRLDIRRCRRRCRSGHRRRCRGRWGRWRGLAACGDKRQSGRNHQRFSYNTVHFD